ncbi:bifunctional purine biosynthesis protein PurH [Abditibacteriota bacterium]|nr:bifunctional purine biosynthesis protein PurH [Abditibacteriota bacterium]
MKRALLSVSNKNSLAPFAAALVELGFEILSTGGTARTLREAGLSVTDVSDVTGFPEMMDGRVKTLHPAIHGGLLALRDNPEHVQAIASQSIAPIDLVCVNLYPFENTVARPDVTLEEAIENIDIGGPSMVRSAAKNYQSVTIVVDPADYNTILAEMRANGDTSLETRKQLAVKAFAHTSAYDGAITTYLSGQKLPASLRLSFEKEADLRYGENPHQSAAFYADSHAPQGSLARAIQLSGIGLSFVNLFDLDGAWNLVCEFDAPAACIVKHANPCGCAVAETLSEAFIKARDADPVSRFGGIIACNRVVDVATANEIIVKGSFYHAIIAPGFEREALELLKNRSGWGADLRILDAGTVLEKAPALDWKRISGGLLVQDLDRHELADADLKTVTQVAPTTKQIEDLKFAWKCVKHLKSNAIAIAKNGSLIGAGAGQMNRVTSVKLALDQAGENAQDAVLASDAFFPFDDGPRLALDAGVKAFIQPGGSNRDADSIKACDEHGAAMVFSGIRHFKH